MRKDILFIKNISEEFLQTKIKKALTDLNEECRFIRSCLYSPA